MFQTKSRNVTNNAFLIGHEGVFRQFMKPQVLRTIGNHDYVFFKYQKKGEPFGVVVKALKPNSILAHKTPDENRCLIKFCGDTVATKNDVIEVYLVEFLGSPKSYATYHYRRDLRDQTSMGC